MGRAMQTRSLKPPFRSAALIALLCGSSAAFAQEAEENPLSLSGSVRARYELVDDHFRPGLGERDDIFNLRTILTAEYDAGPIRIGAELRDSRAYDADPEAISTSIVNTVELVQAWVAADLGEALGAGSESSVQLGRFTMDLGSRRVVADDTYRNTTNGFTGIRFDHARQGGLETTLFFTMPQRRLPDDEESLLDNEVEVDRESFDTIFWGGIASVPVGGLTAEAYYYRFRERDGDSRATRNRKLHNLGARLIREPEAGQLDFEVEGNYQFGSIRASSAADAPKLDVGAWFLHAEAGYTFAGPWAPRLSIEYDGGSGDGAGRGFGRYDTLFGSRSGDFGPSGIYGPFNRTNVQSAGLRVEAEPSDRLDFYLSWRAMWLDKRTDSFSTTGVRDPAGLSGSFGGHHLEGRLRYWAIPDHLRLELNAAWLGKARFLENAPNAPPFGDSSYVALSGTVSF